MVISKKLSNKPVISIIVPCYNQGAFLYISLSSLINQTYTNWLCIIINDGSTDETEKVAKEYCAKDKRFKYYAKRNKGLSNTRNFGLKKATGDFIQFLDADDALLPEKLEKQLKELIEQNAALCICDYKKIKYENKQEMLHLYKSPFPNGDELNALILDWEVRFSIPCHCILFHRSLLSQKIHFNETLPNHEDWAFWVELFMQKPKIVFLKQPLCIYYYFERSMSTQKELMKQGFIMAGKYLIKKIHKEKLNTHLIDLVNAKLKETEYIYSLEW